MFKLFLGVFVVSLASAEVLYPCGQPAPLECVTAYLAEFAGCKAPEIPVSDVYTHKPFLIETPFFRSSIYRYENTIEGGIKDATYHLFTDSEADLTVLTWNFASVKVYGRQQFQYHSPGQIDTVLDTGYGVTFNDIQVTAQWPGVESITIGTGKRYAFIGSSEIPSFEEAFPELAAEIANNPEGIAAQTHALGLANRQVLLREVEDMVGNSFAAVSRKYILCESYEE